MENVSGHVVAGIGITVMATGMQFHFGWEQLPSVQQLLQLEVDVNTRVGFVLKTGVMEALITRDA